MSNLQPVPQPGLAIFPSLLTSSPLSLTMKGSALGGTNYTITDNNTNATLFTLTSQNFSAHHKKTLFDSSGQPLFEISKDTWCNRYSATRPSPSSAAGAHSELFRSETHGTKGLVNGGDTVLTFTNHTSGSADKEQQPIQLQFQNNASINVRATVIEMASGMVVGRIDKQNWKMRHQYQVEVAAGMDPSIVVALAVIMADVRATKAARAGNAGGAGGGAGFAMAV